MYTNFLTVVVKGPVHMVDPEATPLLLKWHGPWLPAYHVCVTAMMHLLEMLQYFPILLSGKPDQLALKGEECYSFTVTTTNIPFWTGS